MKTLPGSPTGSKQTRRSKVIWAGVESPLVRARTEVPAQGPRRGARLHLKDATLEQTATLDALKLHSNVANIGDGGSLVITLASTTHSQLSAEELEKIGVPELRAPGRALRTLTIFSPTCSWAI